MKARIELRTCPITRGLPTRMTRPAAEALCARHRAGLAERQDGAGGIVEAACEGCPGWPPELEFIEIDERGGAEMSDKKTRRQEKEQDEPSRCELCGTREANLRRRYGQMLCAPCTQVVTHVNVRSDIVSLAMHQAGHEVMSAAEFAAARDLLVCCLEMVGLGAGGNGIPALADHAQALANRLADILDITSSMGDVGAEYGDAAGDGAPATDCPVLAGLLRGGDPGGHGEPSISSVLRIAQALPGLTLGRVASDDALRASLRCMSGVLAHDMITMEEEDSHGGE